MTRRSARAGLAAALLSGASLFACSLLVPLDDQQCSTNGDCAARGASFAGSVCENHVCVAPSAASDAGIAADADPWACLSQPSEVTTSAPVAITFKVFDAFQPITTGGSQGGSDFTVLSYVPEPGVTVQGCQVLDPACVKPATGQATTDDAGEATLTVPDSFEGFFQFAGPGYLPANLYPARLLAGASTFSPPVAILSTQETALLAGAIGVPMQTDPEAGVGHSFFQVYDCLDHHAPGVSFALGVDGGPNMAAWYLSNGLPSTATKVTDSVGAGGVVNVPAGEVVVTATVAGTGRTIASVNTVVVAGGTTFTWVRARTH